MAIIENKTRNYFKVDLKNSFVQKNMLFASITIYRSEVDRQNEKLRLNQLTLFDENCKKILQNLSENEQDKELYTSFIQAVKYIKDRKYANSDLSLQYKSFSQEITHLLLQCGYQPEWLSRPICILSKTLVNCGLCEEELLTAEYIYGKIKTKMTLDIRDI